MRIYLLFSAAALLVCLSSGICEGQSIGRWRLPSTPAQYCGYGYGPGHHVPMIRKPHCQPLYVPRLAVAPGRCSGACFDASGCNWTETACAGGRFNCNCPQGCGNHFVDEPLSHCPCTLAPDLFSPPPQASMPSPQMQGAQTVAPHRSPTEEVLPVPAEQ